MVKYIYSIQLFNLGVSFGALMLQNIYNENKNWIISWICSGD